MKNTLRKTLTALFAAVMVLSASPTVLDAKPKSMGGSKPSSWGSSKPSSSKPSWGSTKQKKPEVPNKQKAPALSDKRVGATAAGAGAVAATSSSNSEANKPQANKSKTDLAASKKQATSKAPKFKTQAEARKAFAEKNKSKYTSTYATKPATRPNHIPQTYTTPNGRSVNINYNQNYGGYGYYNSLGAFILYDVASDLVMMNALMANNPNYYYGSAQPRVVYRDSGSNLLAIIIGGFVAIVFVVVIIQIMRN